MPISHWQSPNGHGKLQQEGVRHARQMRSGPGASALHFFGAEVRQARETVGMTLADVGAVIPCDASTVSKIGAGQLCPTERFATA